MTDILIRNVEANVAAAIDKLAADSGESRNQFLVGLLTEVANDRLPDFDPELVLCFWQVEPGEPDPAEVECGDCGLPFVYEGVDRGMYLALTGGYTIIGPFCGMCVRDAQS